MSPTEKNEIFTLVHTTLRLHLHNIQKTTRDDFGFIFYFDSIRYPMLDLMYEDDVPMDSKSVCGLIYILLHITEFEERKWLEVSIETFCCFHLFLLAFSVPHLGKILPPFLPIFVKPGFLFPALT